MYVKSPGMSICVEVNFPETTDLGMNFNTFSFKTPTEHKDTLSQIKKNLIVFGVESSMEERWTTPHKKKNPLKAPIQHKWIIVTNFSFLS